MREKPADLRTSHRAPSRPWRAALRAACAALLVSAGCSVEADRPAGSDAVSASAAANPMELTTSVASRLIRSHDEFREPVYVEVVSKGASSTSRMLEAEGLVTFTDRKKELFRLTPKARAAGAKEVVYRVDAPILMFPVSERQLVEVSAIEELPALGSSRRLVFTYRRSPNELGRTLRAAGWDIEQVRPGEPRQGKALVGLYEDGWRIEMLTL